MGVSLYAVEHGYIDDIELDKIIDFETAFHTYMNAEYSSLMDKINDTGDYNDDIADENQDRYRKLQKESYLVGIDGSRKRNSHQDRKCKKYAEDH